MREDKTKNMVLLDRSRYDSFLEEYTEQTRPRQVAVDPTLKIAAAINRLTKHMFFPTIWKHEKVDALVCPRLFAYIKTHKSSVTARLIVEKRSAPMYNLEKVVA